MSPPLGQSSLVTVALVSLLVLSGCTAVTDIGGDDTPDLPTGDAAVEGYQSFDTMSATVRTTVTDGNATADGEQSAVRRARIVQRPSSGESWSETLAPDNRSGDLVVSNESVTWSYDASDDSATRIDGSAFEAGADTYPQYLQQLFDAVNDESSESESESVGVSPLPVVPGTPAGPRAAGAMGQQHVEYTGTATVDGRSTHVFDLTPRDADGETAVLHQTVYLDAEHFVPVRQRMTFRLSGNVTTYDVAYRNVSFDADVAAGRFQFDPPAGTNVSETSLPTSTVYESADALRANASMAVPTPDVPDGFTLDRARHTVSTERNYSRVALTYENERGMVSVASHDTTDVYTGTADGENVSVGSATGTYREFGTVSTVGWACDDSYHAVSSDVLSRDRLLDVARSMTCRTDSASNTS